MGQERIAHPWGGPLRPSSPRTSSWWVATPAVAVSGRSMMAALFEAPSVEVLRLCHERGLHLETDWRSLMGAAETHTHTPPPPWYAFHAAMDWFRRNHDCASVLSSPAGRRLAAKVEAFHDQPGVASGRDAAALVRVALERASISWLNANAPASMKGPMRFAAPSRAGTPNACGGSWTGTAR
jgi:hypothetical protein